MSHINFKTIFAKNFRSIDNVGLTINYNNGKSTLVASTDNGSGKSTIWRDALFYLLFDKPYAKGQTKSQLINSRSGNGCLVRGEFEKGGVEYVVERGQKPSVFNITVDGTPLNKEAVDFQKTLLDILGSDEKLFSNSIILGADKFVPFTTMGAEERRKFGDQMLDLLVVSVMSNENKQRLKAINTELDIKQPELLVIETKITAKKEIIEVKKQNGVEKENKILSNIEQIKGRIKQNHSDRELLGEEIEALTKQETLKKDELRSVEQTIFQEFSGPINDLKSEIEKAKSLTSDQDTKELRRLQDELVLQNKDVTRLQVEYNAVESDFKNKYAEQAQYVKIVEGLKEKLENLKAPDRNSPCSHCGGVVGDDYFAKHQAEYEASKAKLVAGIAQGEEMLETYASLDHAYAQFDEHGSTELEAAKEQVEKTKLAISEVEKRLYAFESEKRGAIDKAEANLKQKQSDLKTELANRSSGIKSELATIEANIRSKNDQSTQLLSTLSGHERDIAFEEKTLADLKANSDFATDESDLLLLESDKAQLDTEITDLFKKKEIQELMVKCLKDDGIKAKMVDNYVPYLNDRINFYLEKMSFYVRIEMNNEYELEMFAPDRKGQTISCLSAGQQKRIDLAVLMAWRDLARQASTNSCNILIMDEVLEAMSQNGIIDFMEMWRGIDESKFTNLVVITQRKDEFSSLFDECKFYKLVDNTTVEISENE
ncbi:hypothetical protein SHAb15599_00104 [Acinetobacter phage SH-Ab 15599]|nr:hypothetical protein SHAb15599_00104 [Acinetobacter phage SH-Ab 15599]